MRVRNISRLLGLVGLGALGFTLQASGAELINGIKAVVSTSVITYGEIESDVALVAEDLYRRYGRQPAVFQEKVDAARRESFERAEKHQLILHDFTQKGYSLPEAVIDEVVADEIKRYGDRATLTKTLQARGMTFEKWRQQIKERFLVSQLRRKNIAQETIISPHKIEVYYQAHQSDYRVSEQVKLRMIMLNKGDEAATAGGARELAREILAKLKSGAPFAEMASIYSQGAQRTQGGEWGWTEKSVLRPELAEAAFQLGSGEISDVIETPQAFFIMLVEDKRADHIKPISEVRDEIETILQQQESARLEASYIDKLKKETFIRIFDY